MRNVAIINTCDWGSTGKIAFGLQSNLKSAGYTAIVCYGRGERDNTEDRFCFDSKTEVYLHALKNKLIGRQGTGSTMATKRLISRLKSMNIDTVYAINLHGYYLNEELFLNYIAEEDITLVYIMADESAFLGKCTYRSGCTNVVNGCKNCPQTNGLGKIIQPDSAERSFMVKKDAYSKIKKSAFMGPQFVIDAAQESPLLKGQNLVPLDEAIDTTFYSPKDTSALKMELGIADDKVVLVCVAPMSYERKGVRYFIETARALENKDKYVFVHVGYNVKDRTNLPSNLIALDPIYDQERLSFFYSLADLFIFPSLHDTMPNACLEALSAGSPLLCFNTSGMPYMMDDTVGYLVEPRNVEQMVEVVLQTEKKTDEIVKACREYALKRYDNRVYAKKLIDIAIQIENN